MADPACKMLRKKLLGKINLLVEIVLFPPSQPLYPDSGHFKIVFSFHFTLSRQL